MKSSIKSSISNLTLSLLVAALFVGLGTTHGFARIDSFFDIFTEQSPPAPAVQAKVSTETAPLLPIAQVAMKVNGTTPPGLTTRMVGSDSGGGGGATPGVNSFFDVFLEGSFMVSSFFDIFTEVSTDGGAPLLITNAPTLVWHTDSFFDVFLEVYVPGQGNQSLKMEFRVPEDQTVKFNLNPTNSFISPSSFFDVWLEVVPTAGGPINPTLPLFRVVMTGTLGWQQPWPVPGNVVKFRQKPDPSIRGMDVLDSWLTNNGPATLLADDFICTRTGPVTDIHVWGSWLNDLVDYWPTFWVGIWDDVPRSGNVASHPGQLLWWQQFSPGQYRASLQQTVPLEQFLDPNAPPKLLGLDHQIWKYDFFPKTPFRQLGSPQLPKVYWLSVVTKTAPGRVFGWKTTPDHYNDFAVYASTPLTFSGGYPMPTNSWQVITDHQGRKRELSFMLTTSQTWACNKDFWNPWPYPYSNVRVILPGPWGISDNFNGFGGLYPQFNSFAWDWNSTGQTVMDWSDGVVAAGQWVHIGFEGPGAFPPFLNWGWWNPFGMNWWGWIPQVSIGWPQLPLSQPFNIGLTNILPIVPGLTNNVLITGLKIEYYTNAVPLAQLNRNPGRTPIGEQVIPVSQPPQGIPPGGSIQVQINPPPPEATHAVLIPVVSPVDAGGQPLLQFASTDWAMTPLTEPQAPALPPAPVLQSPAVVGTDITLTWSAQPGSIYRVQSRTAVATGTWQDEEGDLIASETTASKTLALTGSETFYRVMALLP
ncbi:MAG: hypothetical protein MUF81_01185 [Verrucomicrobia bacterium]|jgi:hypothetical protein|nr:hypothetical protein [Verrucomicrobiota bacterium]